MRDGVVNEYALHFNVPVAANVRDIAFTWQSLAGRPVTPTSILFIFQKMKLNSYTAENTIQI